MSPYYLPRLLMVGMRWNAYPSIDHRQMPLKVLVESLVLRKTDKIRFICTNANAIHALLLCSYVSCLLSDKIKVYMHKCKCNPYTAIVFINIRCLLWHKIRFTQGRNGNFFSLDLLQAQDVLSGPGHLKLSPALLRFLSADHLFWHHLS